MSIFFERFQNQCNALGRSPNAIAKELGIPSGSVSAWKSGAIPRAYTIKRLAEFFGVSASYLLGQEYVDPMTGKPYDPGKYSRLVDYEEETDTNEADSQKALVANNSESSERPIIVSSYTYALEKASRRLTDSDKQLLLSMAQQLADARKEQNGKTD